jgi:hypothetical protein
MPSSGRGGMHRVAVTRWPGSSLSWKRRAMGGEEHAVGLLTVSGHEAIDDPSGRLDYPRGIAVSLLRVGILVLLGRDEVHVAVERQLSLPAQSLRDRGRPRELAPHVGDKERAVLDEQWTDVVNFGGFHAHRPEHSLEGQLDELLGLADHVGVSFVVSQHGQGFQPRPRALAR